MAQQLAKWQRDLTRNQIHEYRKALEQYYIRNKPIIETAGGKAFSLLSPPLGSAASRRRLRYIVTDMLSQQQGANDGKKPLRKVSRTPHFVTIAITYHCQCSCTHCSASHYQEQASKGNGTLSTAELKRVIRQTIALGATCIVLTGGEPLLDEGLEQLVETVDPSKAICTIFTNAERLDEVMVTRLKKAGVFGVYVSFDYADRLQHDRNRGRSGIYEKACAGIKLCRKHGILTGISTYATKEKMQTGELTRLMELGKDLNVLEVFLFDVIPVGRLSGKRESILGEDEFEWIRQFRKYYNEKSDYPRIIHQTMLTSIASPCTGEGCPAGTAHMHIRANGDVSPCDFTPFSFGNVRAQALGSIWESLTSHEMYAGTSRHCRLSQPAVWDKLEALSRLTATA